MNIRTNRNWRQFVYYYDVPADILESQFDYQDAPDDGGPIDGYFCYKGIWYHLDMFMRVPDGMFNGEKWAGYHGDSFFSGVLVNISDDGEEYQVATYFS